MINYETSWKNELEYFVRRDCIILFERRNRITKHKHGQSLDVIALMRKWIKE